MLTHISNDFFLHADVERKRGYYFFKYIKTVSKNIGRFRQWTGLLTLGKQSKYNAGHQTYESSYHEICVSYDTYIMLWNKTKYVILVYMI